MRIIILCTLFTILFCYPAALAVDNSKKEEKEVALVSVDLQPGGIKRIPLNQSFIVIREEDSNKIKRIPITLVRTSYNYTKLMIEHDNRRKSGSLTCHELQSRGEEDIFTWAMWSASPQGHFRLFSDGESSCYLLWVEQGGSVRFTKVSEPKDKLVELTEYLSSSLTEEYTWVPVYPLIGRQPFEGDNALYGEINVVSLQVEENGKKITVELTGCDRNKIYTLVFENNRWVSIVNDTEISIVLEDGKWHKEVKKIKQE